MEAEIPAGAEAVVEVIGTTGDIALMRKGRRGGLWMSVGEIQIRSDAEPLSVMTSSPHLPELTGATMPWGFDALKSQITFSGSLDAHEKDRFSKEFIRAERKRRLIWYYPLEG